MRCNRLILTAEQLEIKELVHSFAEKEVRPIASEFDRSGEFPFDLYKTACKMQLNCLDLPEEYGGPGISKVTACIVREELSWGDAGFALSVGAKRTRHEASPYCRNRGTAQTFCGCGNIGRLFRLCSYRARRRLGCRRMPKHGLSPSATNTC